MDERDEVSLVVLNQKLVALERAMEARFESLTREQMMRDEALIEAKSSIAERLKGMNEFREEMSRQEAQYLKTTDFQREHASILQRVDANKEIVNAKIELLEKSWREQFDASAKSIGERIGATTDAIVGRIGRVERFQYMVIGALLTIQLLIGLVLHFWK